jgi:hypothetical protein
LVRIGKIDFKDGIAEPAIYPPYATTALIPTNCWRSAKCKAIKIAILLFFFVFNLLSFTVLLYDESI